MSFALPSLRSTRARPRPVRTTTRSPGRMSPLPFRSIVTGTFGTKYGSPTNSLPRLVDLDDEVVGQTLRKRRMVKPEPAAPSSRSGSEQNQRVEREGDRVARHRRP